MSDPGRPSAGPFPDRQREVTELDHWHHRALALQAECDRLREELFAAEEVRRFVRYQYNDVFAALRALWTFVSASRYAMWAVVPSGVKERVRAALAERSEK